MEIATFEPKVVKTYARNANFANIEGYIFRRVKVSYFEWNIIHISKFKPGTVVKNSSTNLDMCIIFHSK